MQIYRLVRKSHGASEVIMKGGDINCGQKGGIPGKRIFQVMTRSRVAPWKFVHERGNITAVKLLRAKVAQSCLWTQMSFWMRENLEWREQCEPGARFSMDQEQQLAGRK